MKLRSLLSLLPILISVVMQAQDKKASLDQTAFSAATIKWNSDTQLPTDIKLDAATSLNKEEFFTSLRSAFELPDRLQFVPEKEGAGPRGDSHIRYTQHYKGIELARTQYIVHMKEDRVIHAHGHLVGEPSVNLVPSLDFKEAYRFACSHLGVNEYEAKQNGALMSRLSFRSDAGRENGKLLLSSGFKEKTPENYRLVYCFDITTVEPLRRYNVEINAHSGELVGTYPTLYHENIPTTGNSLYNDMVDIVISDTIFESEWPDNEAYWHPDEWNAYQGSGTSWWMADTENFTPGGYDNDWHVVLETDPILLSGSDLQLTFYHRYALEDPDGASDYDRNYDGWDGVNVRISSDGGNTWQVLTGPIPSYTCTSLWSFGGIHKEGPGIPGWAGRQLAWRQVSFDLSAYLNETVHIRFDFASDGGYASVDDNSLFGWQIDEIQVRNNSETLFTNPGNRDNIHEYSISNWVGTIEGKYRLRETTRGNGIATINAESGLGFTNYVDFVQDTFPITSAANRAGVSVHWASERTYDYFLETFNRDSYDDEGGAIVSYADWTESDDVNNAFWTGSFAAYGAGDGELRGSYGAIDVVGHELSHGVTEHSADLVYQGESGALNESFSDIFGTAVEFYAEGSQTGDWLIGEDIYKGLGSIRSMRNPKALSDPDTYLGEHWIDAKLSYDNGGVHINSGVQNHWFYLLTEGGSGENDDGFSFQVTGIGLADASAIAYRNLTQYLLPDSKYMDAASYSVQAAEDLFGEESQQVRSARSAWEAVGIYMNSRLFTNDTLLNFESSVDDSEFVLLILRNKGIETLDITEFQFSDPGHFSFLPPQETPLQIDGGDSLRLWLVFSPEQAELYEETLTIECSDPINPVQTIYLSGLGTGSTTGLPDNIQRIQDVELSVTPNPFRDRFLISYELPQPDRISIEIRDITGKLLYQSTREASGKESVEITWSSIPDHSQAASGGIYLISLRTSTKVLVKKIVKR
ncbi:MAG: M4 family metallopeptidase [Bacteroidota bacterium]|nr:M4 family metallopeptidase [Bacteroidota bacterium]